MDFFSAFVPIILMVAIIYMLIWRPEQLKRKKHQAMLENLAKGNLVVTTGGLHGKIGVDKELVVLAIAENVKVEVSRSAIAFLKKGGELIEGE
jgi:preprotein translocase subunit YajC